MAVEKSYERLPTSESDEVPNIILNEADDVISRNEDESMRFRLKINRIIDFKFSGWAILLACLSFFAVLGYHSGSNCDRFMSLHRSEVTDITRQKPTVAVDHSLVPFEAHIMSKCPDARDCLRQLVLPSMQRVLPHVNFTLSYIGTPTANDGVSCLHGAPECMGNILELCAADLYPDPKIYLGFTMCLSRDFKDIPDRDLVEDCALEHGIEFEKLNNCASAEDGGTGMKMLRDSVQRSSDAGVTMSCTVRVNEEIYCIRDGGEWKDCPNGSGVNDLVIAIEKLYSSS